jgi:hydrogenase/urease accessory protein HupE
VTVLLFCSVAFWLLPAPAAAHLVTTGLGPVYDGISHVLYSPDDLLPVLAVAFLGGLNGVTAARRALFALTGAWLLGGCAGALTDGVAPPAGITAVSFLVLGGLTAADRRLSAAVVAWLALVVGLLHGWLNGAAMAETWGLVGIASAIFVMVALAAALIVSARAAWARVAVRVAGSWVAAIGLLMLGWNLRGGG